MWKRCLLLMLFVWGCLLYAPTAMACEEGTPAYLADYQAFLREYGEALVENRDTIRYWQVNAAAKVAGIDGTGYAFVWIDGDDVPMLLIGNPDSWHVWQAYTWSKGKIYNLYPEGDPNGAMWVTEDKKLYLEIATLSWGYCGWSDKYPHATALSFVAAYTQELETGLIRYFCGEYEEDGLPIWHKTYIGVEKIRAMMPTSRILELDWHRLSELQAS